jgi:hypothetical protein
MSALGHKQTSSGQAIIFALLYFVIGKREVAAPSRAELSSCYVLFIRQEASKIYRFEIALAVHVLKDPEFSSEAFWPHPAHQCKFW